MILAVTGLQRERRIVTGPGVEAIAGGGNHKRLEAVLEARVVGAHGIISIGIAGGLAPGLRAGDWVVADSSGVVFIKPADIGQVLDAAEAIAAREAAMSRDVEAGAPVSQVMGAGYEQMLKREERSRR